MSCNRILKAITNRMPPKCFNCCVWDMYDDELNMGYCWLLERTTIAGDKPEDCPLEVEQENDTERTKSSDFNDYAGLVTL